MLAAMIAGCALIVLLNSSSGPSKIIWLSFLPKASSTSSNTSLANEEALYKSNPIPTL